MQPLDKSDESDSGSKTSFLETSDSNITEMETCNSDAT